MSVFLLTSCASYEERYERLKNWVDNEMKHKAEMCKWYVWYKEAIRHWKGFTTLKYYYQFPVCYSSKHEFCSIRCGKTFKDLNDTWGSSFAHETELWEWINKCIDTCIIN